MIHPVILEEVLVSKFIKQDKASDPSQKSAQMLKLISFGETDVQSNKLHSQESVFVELKKLLR